VVPEPIAVLGVIVPNTVSHTPGFVVSYRNQPVVEYPFAVTDALSVAVVAVIGVAASVATDGADVVINETTAPNDVPTEFCAMAQ
jgi:hypothetical protein